MGLWLRLGGGWFRGPAFCDRPRDVQPHLGGYRGDDDGPGPHVRPLD